jgi:hypothetical protein
MTKPGRPATDQAADDQAADDLRAWDCGILARAGYAGRSMTRVRIGLAQVANVVVALVLVVLALMSPVHPGPRLGPAALPAPLTLTGAAPAIPLGSPAVDNLPPALVVSALPAAVSPAAALAGLAVTSPGRVAHALRVLIVPHRPWLRHLAGGPAVIGFGRPVPAQADVLFGIATILLLLLGIAAPARRRVASRVGQWWPASRAPPVPVG